jgi:peptidoglycan/xylan/chitin deacetylase (PgdA/CDA1 family)
MGRLLLFAAILVSSLAGYLFANATTLPTDRPGSAVMAAEVATFVPVQNSTAVPAQSIHATVDGPGAVAERLRQSPVASAGRPAAQRLNAAHGDGPPRHAARHAIRALPILRLPASLPDRTIDIPILMYHHVSSVAPLTDLNYGLTVTDANLEAQLTYLRQNGYHTIMLRQAFDAMYRGAHLPNRPVVLTFDDGYLDNYTDALPILRKYHDVAEFNIISAYVGISVGINSYMTWAQLKTLVSGGMEIGSHTVDHQDLGILTTDKVRFELRDSRNILQTHLGVPVQFMAYPSGEPFDHGSLEAQQRVLSLLPQYGYVGALLDGPLTSGKHNERLPFQLWRIRVAGGEGLADFADLLHS